MVRLSPLRRTRPGAPRGARGFAWLAAVLALGLGPAFAQAEKPLLVNGTALVARYPQNRGISYAPARPFAQALGLGYLDAGGDLYLTLGARGVRLAVAASEKEAVTAKPLAAYRAKDAVYLPVKAVAQALGARYLGSRVSLKVTLPPARYQSHLLSQEGEADQLFVGFSRDANLIPLGGGAFRVVGGKGEAGFWPLFGRHLYGLELAPDPYGLKLVLRGAEGQPLGFAPVPGGAVFWVGPRRSPEDPPRVVIDGGESAATLAAAKAAVRVLADRGLRAELSAAKDPVARAEAGARADVFLVLAPGAAPAVYSYRPRGSALALRFVVKAREALLLGGAPPGLLRQVAPAEASSRLAELLARALGAPRGQAEIALLAWAPKAAALVELPAGGAADAGAKIAGAVLRYFGRSP